MYSGIPSQVQAGADKADKLINEQLLAENDGVDPNADPKPDPDNPEDTKVLVVGETVESLTVKLSAAIQKFDVLQGKYNAEIKALGDDPNLLNTIKAENKNLKRQNVDYGKIINDQQNELVTLRSSPAKPTEPLPGAAELSEEDLAHLKVEALDGKTLEIIKKMVASEAEKIVQMRYGDLSAKLENRIETVEKSNAVNHEDRFEQDLTKAVPNWKAINGWDADGTNPEPEWVEFLGEMAPFQNRTYHEVIKEAQGQGNVKTCADVFNAYLSKKGAAPPGPTPEPVDDPLKIDPAANLDPGRSGSGDMPTDLPTYTMAEYQKFMNDATKNPRKMNSDAWIKQNAVYNKALSDGRIK